MQIAGDLPDVIIVIPKVQCAPINHARLSNAGFTLFLNFDLYMILVILAIVA